MASYLIVIAVEVREGAGDRRHEMRECSANTFGDAAQKSFVCGTSLIATSLRPNSRASREIAPGPSSTRTTAITPSSNAAILESIRGKAAGGTPMTVITALCRLMSALATGVRNPTMSTRPEIIAMMAAQVMPINTVWPTARSNPASRLARAPTTTRSTNSAMPAMPDGKLENVLCKVSLVVRDGSREQM